MQDIGNSVKYYFEDVGLWNAMKMKKQEKRELQQ